MSFTYKNNISITIWGTSHSDYMGVSLDGIKPGLIIDHDLIQKDIQRRKPVSGVSTTRTEKDEYTITSGEFNGRTTGDILTVLIKNNNTISKHYDKDIMRPNHADFSSYIKTKGYHDFRGGGKFSGRLTVLFVIIGSIAKQIIKNDYGIEVFSQVNNIGNIFDENIDFENINIEKLQNMTTPLISVDKYNQIFELVKETRSNGDSIGGAVNVYASNVPVGIGEPYFNSVESVFSHLMYSIPAVKAIEFGHGVNFSTSLGSEVSDEMFYEDKIVKFTNNFNGGITGGITNSNIVSSKVTFKPTPSIYIKQKTIDASKNENVEYQINGRHDPCIVIRTAVICESIMSLTLLDLIC